MGIMVEEYAKMIEKLSAIIGLEQELEDIRTGKKAAPTGTDITNTETTILKTEKTDKLKTEKSSINLGTISDAFPDYE